MSDTANPDPLGATIAFQGAPGAYSNLACHEAYPGLQAVPCNTFEDVFAAVRAHEADLAMIPVDNSTAGRVADIHHLLPHSGLYIIGEHFHRVNHQLLVLDGVALADLREVHSHVHALSQCRGLIRRHGLEAVVRRDTAGAAAELAASGRRDVGVIASRLAAEIHDLHILMSDIEDHGHNTTRFVVMAREPLHPDIEEGPVMTSFFFKVRSVPAALYKALGGFATNGVNMTKLESYMLGESFDVAQFYADIEGHPDDRLVRLALEELSFFSNEVRILGVYPQHPYRLGAAARMSPPG
jgi:prephenate dehydratase